MDFIGRFYYVAELALGAAAALAAGAGLGAGLTLGALAVAGALAAAGALAVSATLASVLVSGLASVPTPELAPSLALPASPPRKSVTYQPEPLS